MVRSGRPLRAVLVVSALVLVSTSCSDGDAPTKPSSSHHTNQSDPTDLVGMKIGAARKVAHTNGYEVRAQHLSDWSAARRKTLPGSAVHEPAGTVVTWAVCPDDCRPEEGHLLNLVVTP